jgi:hypothetical protein
MDELDEQRRYQQRGLDERAVQLFDKFDRLTGSRWRTGRPI